MSAFALSTGGENSSVGRRLAAQHSSVLSSSRPYPKTPIPTIAIASKLLLHPNRVLLTMCNVAICLPDLSQKLLSKTDFRNTVSAMQEIQRNFEFCLFLKMFFIFMFLRAGTTPAQYLAYVFFLKENKQALQRTGWYRAPFDPELYCPSSRAASWRIGLLPA